MNSQHAVVNPNHSLAGSVQGDGQKVYGMISHFISGSMEGDSSSGKQLHHGKVETEAKQQLMQLASESERSTPALFTKSNKDVSSPFGIIIVANS